MTANVVLVIYNNDKDEDGSDVVLKDEHDAISWNFLDKSAAEAFAADLEGVFRKNDKIVKVENL